MNQRRRPAWRLFDGRLPSTLMPVRPKTFAVVLFVVSAVVATACGGVRSPDPALTSPTARSEDPPPPSSAPPDKVTLTSSTVAWETYQYETTRFGTIAPGSYDGQTRSSQTFETWVLENEYLVVTLLPEFGGRILSIVYKPTGHEQLYQNPVGVPYQIDTNVFYFNWLMVYGGIFPTFPEPEHGKTWFAPWRFEVVEDTPTSVTVAMSFVDETDHPFVPSQYDGSATGLELTYMVTLTSGRAAVDVEVVIDNPTDETASFEYWTNATLAPGSEPGDTRTGADAEIVAPVDLIRIPSYWEGIAAQEEPTGLIDVYRFDRLRRFGNWSDLGIAYAFPDMGGAGFWGVIDHMSGEGIFRIADNSITPGLKIWTWGYPQTADIDPQAGPNEARPYIELWAGLTREFFTPTKIGPGEVIRIDETYAPTVGLENVTHANRDVLVDLSVADGQVTADVFGLHPGQSVSALLTLAGQAIYEGEIAFDPGGAASLGAGIPDGGTGALRLELTDTAGSLLFEGVLGLDDA